ncbi:OmcA/MtrC family decaheme c-type cytochrome [Anaeromyxobacter paludicola]|uniref:Surface localized decaheme cytochrome c lipoprotein n=1 Tax=Anaeromyxobacter paludicola TaxID=2918171 RepID=A0ABN6N4K0_9BACT|nr:OmcA/MtrC family decaheme c-type cytochrome [Anaeromyxobacter paludicola]BDG06978.1 surface localized decaheme cytochrome c lipoprotein [Anaeromyxobacter paludicola]
MKPSARLGSTALLVAAIVFTGCSGSRGSAGPQGPAGTPGPAGPAGGTTGVSTGLNINITNAAITADRHPYAIFTILDNNKNPQAAAGISFNWTIAYLGTDATSGIGAYQSYILQTVTGNAPGGAAGTTQQPTSESGTAGTLTDLGGGQFQYTFKLTLPATYSATATHRIGMWASRPLPGTGTGASNPTQNDIANAVLDFVPAGGTPQTRDLTASTNCNACHGILQVHGGFRRDYRLCMTCHTTQLADPDTNDTGNPANLNPLDLGTLVHRIHRGKALPTLTRALAAANAGDATGQAWEYHVIGFRNGDNVYGSVIANPNTASTTKFVATGVQYPRFNDLRNCAACHAQVKDQSGKVIAAAQADQWQTTVSRRTCGSCHDDVWFGDPSQLPKFHKMHGSSTDPTQGLPQANDAGCATCHPRTQGSGSYSLAVADAHQHPEVAIGVANPFTVSIVSASGTPGAPATVTFKILDKSGNPIPPDPTLGLQYNASSFPNGLTGLNVVMNGPTSPDYSFNGTNAATPVTSPFRSTEALSTWTGKYNAATGAYTYTFPGTQVIPANATGTWAIAIEGRRGRTVTHPTSHGVENFTEGFVNPVAYFSVDGSTVTPRRTVAPIQQCNACHFRFAFHGGQRRNVEECVMCHAPDASDKPAHSTTAVDNLPYRTIDLKPMLHKIHTGENLDLSQPYFVSGTYFGDKAFPGTRANCAICHQANTFTLDAMPSNASPTLYQQIAAPAAGVSGGDASALGIVGPMGSACLGCHDHSDSVAHVQAMTNGWNTASPVESCTVCHQESSQFSVTSLHAPFANGFRE